MVSGPPDKDNFEEQRRWQEHIFQSLRLLKRVSRISERAEIQLQTILNLFTLSSISPIHPVDLPLNLPVGL